MLADFLRDDLLALSYARYTYRDTSIIEDSHSLMIDMNMNLYDKVKDIVNEKFSEFNTAIKKSLNNKAPKTELEKNIVTILYIYSLNGDQWDSPISIDCAFNGDIGEYILGGAFKDGCNKGKPFGDSTVMKEINKDVYNRYYTLIHNNVL